MSSLLTVKQVAERLVCSLTTAYGLIEDGELGHYRCPGIRVSEEQLAAYLQGAERGPVLRKRFASPRPRLKHISI